MEVTVNTLLLMLLRQKRVRKMTRLTSFLRWVESSHQYIESMRTAYLADQRRRGDGNDPFFEADRRETARQEAAAKRVHLTLHLPANSQPSTQVAGLPASSGTHGKSVYEG